MSRLALFTVSVFSLLAIILFYRAVLDVEKNLSPQGCRMSWMQPSYIWQDAFNASWTPLASRYSLWLYRENGHEYQDLHQGIPVLFIPGNAGSSRQVRSIASSAAHQYFSSPFVPNSELVARGVKPLDVFAVEFNEDLSAFHGPTLEAEAEYTSKAISYILSFYPLNTSIVILGHSMGGIVATSLASERIAAIITMSTPHVLPPARFDPRVEEIYDRNLVTLKSSQTPIVSLCGGATDMMIPSESCILPPADSSMLPFRRTVFSSALEGSWTGVGHREMVWCHQVRWRVAKAALELGATKTLSEKGAVLDQWLSDGHVLRHVPEQSLVLTNHTMYELIPPSMHLQLRNPHGSRVYLLNPPIVSSSASTPLKLVVYVSQGSIPPISPQNPTLRLNVYLCNRPSHYTDLPIRCTTLQPTLHKLIPNPPYGKSFPIPEQGTDESEGVVLFEADMPMELSENSGPWVGLQIEQATGSGWVVAGFTQDEPYVDQVSTWRLLFNHAWTAMPDKFALRTSMSYPRLISDALVVYRLDLYTQTSKCIDPLLPPLLMHTSHESETHYFPLTQFNPRRILLHTHASAPFAHATPQKGLSFTIYSSGTYGCSTDLVGFDIRMDWPATLGRWGSRYFTALATWTVGIVSLIIYESWGVYDRTATIPPLQRAMSNFCRRTFPKALLLSFFVSLLPLPEWYYLGNQGAFIFAGISPILLFVATGLVFLSWWFLAAMMWILGTIGNAMFRGRPSQEATKSVRRSTIVSMLLVFTLVFLLIPWQVAYLTCWFIHLCNCASMMYQKPSQSSSIPLTPQSDDAVDYDSRLSTNRQHMSNNCNHSLHLLLLMTWLLPLAAPVLVVWVRTLATAGLTTPFDGDHFFLNVAPFLILVDFASWTAGPLFVKQRFENRYLSVRSCFALLAGAAFLIGPRKAYLVFDLAKISVGVVVAVRVGPRYLGKASWSE